MTYNAKFSKWIFKWPALFIIAWLLVENGTELKVYVGIIAIVSLIYTILNYRATKLVIADTYIAYRNSLFATECCIPIKSIDHIEVVKRFGVGIVKMVTISGKTIVITYVIDPHRVQQEFIKRS